MLVYIYVPSVAYVVLNGSLLEEASKHYFGKSHEFLVAYAASLGSSIFYKINDSTSYNNFIMKRIRMMIFLLWTFLRHQSIPKRMPSRRNLSIVVLPPLPTPTWECVAFTNGLFPKGHRQGGVSGRKIDFHYSASLHDYKTILPMEGMVYASCFCLDLCGCHCIWPRRTQ